jgi:hypothetical protein
VPRFVLAPSARRDLVAILEESEQRFGLLDPERHIGSDPA